ncbi:hypothetical protein JXB37_05895 [candidate division WOR-3 bacterium]|nr:hypothetical protein [candidate division WOR-3 bacterium]
MATDPTRRIENWDTKFDTDRVKAILDAKRPKMLEHVSSVVPALASMEGQVKQVLDGEGVSIILYPFYLAFGREMWRLQHNQEMSGESYAVEAQTLIQKWVARGLSQTVLEKMRSDVFSVPAPTP